MAKLFGFSINKRWGIRWYVSRGMNRSWMFYLQFGPGAGYRWVDLPGHSNSIYDGWRCRWLTISGRTAHFGRNIKTRKGIVRWFATLPTSNANLSAYPQW